MSKKKHNHKRKHRLVTVNALFGDKDTFLGAHMFRSLSAASGWCLKHYPEEFEDRDANFEFIQYSHVEARDLLLRLIDSLPETPEKHLIRTTAKLLTSNIVASTQPKPKIKQEVANGRLEASKAFRDNPD